MACFLLGAHLRRGLADLQLSRGDLEDKLHHAAHGQAGRPRRMHLVPDGVTVHLWGKHAAVSSPPAGAALTPAAQPPALL